MGSEMCIRDRGTGGFGYNSLLDVLLEARELLALVLRLRLAAHEPELLAAGLAGHEHAGRGRAARARLGSFGARRGFERRRAAVAALSAPGQPEELAGSSRAVLGRG